MIISFNFFQRIDWISLNNKFLFYNKLQTNHYGYFQFNLCNVDGAEGDATQECFDKTPLLDINGNKKMLKNGCMRIKYMKRSLIFTKTAMAQL